MAHKAYTSKGNRKLLRDRGIETGILEKSDRSANCKRLGAKGGPTPGFDTQAHRPGNDIERCFQAFKQCLTIAARYERIAVSYRGGVILRAINRDLA